MSEHPSLPRPGSGAPGVCRECGRAVPPEEEARVRERLRARFPGISRRWRYCQACTPIVEDLLAAALGPRPAPATRS